MTLPIISIVGRSGAGKTTLIEKLVKELNNRGYRVATIKHDVHGFDIDKEGKDSYRHKNAGARMSVISCPSKVAFVRDVEHDLEIDEIALKFIDEVDIILTEGYKRNNKPKIEVYRKEAYPDLLCDKNCNLIALATDSKHDLNVPQIDINNAEELVDLIEKDYLLKKEKTWIRLEVDGKDIPLKPFIGSMLRQSINGLVSPLKNCGNCGNIVIRLDNNIL